MPDKMISVESKRRHLLQQLASQGGSGVMVSLKPQDDYNLYVMATENFNRHNSFRDKRPQTSGGANSSKLPFRRASTPGAGVVGYSGSRVVGHIYGFNAKMEMLINKNNQQRKISLPQTLQRKIILHNKTTET